MAATLRGLVVEDVAEIVDCLLVGAAACTETSPALADRRRDLAHRIGDALDEPLRPARAVTA
ncbi:hypothetical protein [Kitasatospora sp. NPDC058046]|uniref:hypothetical protein n=1 Tax=Kitasatospora sp. NPDC058046 TaxID=3346312 RepID=UPI0036DEAB08